MQAVFQDNRSYVIDISETNPSSSDTVEIEYRNACTIKSLQVFSSCLTFRFTVPSSATLISAMFAALSSPTFMVTLFNASGLPRSQYDFTA
jgi:hypothetical protein